ncbi:cytochrome P450 [Colletotrichum sublineola]|nr:cytochrome P450 [Colletotrichum sublineola]
MSNPIDPWAIHKALRILILGNWPKAASSLALLVLVILGLQTWLRANPLINVPVVGTGPRWSRRKQFLQGKASQLYIQGYRQFKNSIFRITTSKTKDTICVPPDFLPELRHLPDDVISFSSAINESMQVSYTTAGLDMPMLVHVCRSSLTSALGRLNASILEEATEAMHIQLPQSSEWSEVIINEKLLRIITIVSGRIFVGSNLCRDEGYINTCIDYTKVLMAAVYAITMVPSFLRPFVAPWLPTTRALRKQFTKAEELLQPLLVAHREASEKGEYQDDMIQWILDSQQRFGTFSDHRLAIAQLDLSFAAIHTTSITLTNAFYWLAAKPELIPVLRNDVQQASVHSQGQLTSPILQKMHKLDSFLKEVLRLTPITNSSYQRKVLKSFQLRNHQTVPRGVFIEVPTAGVYQDPDIFPDPEVFDALRYYKLRAAKEALSGSEATEIIKQAQLVSVSPTHLTFGYGKHACPGRFFAVNEMKIIMATLLRHYEIRLPDGVTERYPNLSLGAHSIPDPNRSLLIRRL